MIKAIIFDFHDTVIINGLRLVLSPERLKQLASSTWQPFWRGQITEEQFWQQVAGDFGGTKTWIKHSREVYYQKSRPVKGVLKLIKQLKLNYKIGLLANCPQPWFSDAVVRFKLDKLFDVLVCSAEFGLLKPDKKIYRLICRKLGVSAKDCCYIDDDLTKLEAAQELGMKVVSFKNTNQLIKDLKL